MDASNTENMSGSDLQLMPEALRGALRDLYAWDAPPLYFAGGHAWSDGTVYRYSRQGEDRLLKVMPAISERSLASVAERQAWQEWLSLNGVDTAPPLHSEAGSLAVAVNCEGQEYIVYAWRLVPGEQVQLGDPRECADFYRRWGSLLGKMHRLAKSWPQWRHSACLDASGSPLISREREWEVFHRWFQDDGVRAAWDRMKLALDALPVTRENHGFLHNDPHPGNILAESGRLILIDFDVANYLWFMVEIAICVYSEYSRVNFHSPWARRDAELDAIFITPFMQGYESENTLTAGEYGRVELFLNYRRCLMFACFYEQIRDNAPEHLARMKQDIIQARKYLPEDNWFARRAAQS